MSAPRAPGANLAAGMAKLRTFIETRGRDVARTEEFLPFYALPYVPQPQYHPTFKTLFEPRWRGGVHSFSFFYFFFSHSFTPSHVQSFNRSIVRPFDRSTVRPFDRSTVRPFNRSIVNLLTVQSFDRSIVHTFHSFVHTFHSFHSFVLFVLF